MVSTANAMPCWPGFTAVAKLNEDLGIRMDGAVLVAVRLPRALGHRAPTLLAFASHMTSSESAKERASKCLLKFRMVGGLIVKSCLLCDS